MRLAVADDHRMFLDALCAGLVVQGHDVVGSSDQLEGLVDLVVGWQPDLCLFDVDFGGGSVMPTVGAIRERNPDIFVLLLTGAATPEVWSAYERRVVDGVVNKLCDLSLVSRAIDRVGAGERVVERFVPSLRRRRPPEPVAPSLSSRERAVMELLVGGASTLEMSVALGITTHTVRTHVQSVLRKLGVNSRAKAASLGVAPGGEHAVDRSIR
jgi:two-component system nitrate/nitrite response regulator NarL